MNHLKPIPRIKTLSQTALAAVLIAGCASNEIRPPAYSEVPVSFSGEPVAVRFSEDAVPVWAKGTRPEREVAVVTTELIETETVQQVSPSEVGASVPISPKVYYFSEGDYRLSQTEKAELDSLASQLTASPGYRLRINGYTNEHGPKTFNYGLGLQRAKAVRQYLVSQGVDQNRIQIKSFGETSDLERKAVIEPMLAE